MKNTKTIIWILVVVVIIVGLGAYIFYSSNKNVAPTTGTATNLSTASTSAVTYDNTDYGFTFSLPADWSGYTIVQSFWTGYPLNATTTQQTGTTLLLRNPNWTADAHYEDIPIMIFTIAEWNSYIAGNFSVSAAPIPATELGQNNKYVFALPPRWDYDFSLGYQEAENIISSKPLHPFNL
jgi:hypothetical protein